MGIYFWIYIFGSNKDQKIVKKEYLILTLWDWILKDAMIKFYILFTYGQIHAKKIFFLHFAAGHCEQKQKLMNRI